MGRPSTGCRRGSRKRDFLTLTRGGLRSGNLCLFSRPRTTLSPRERLALLVRVCQFTGRKTRFFVIARSPVLLNVPSTSVCYFSGKQVRLYRCRRARDCRVARVFVGGERVLLSGLLAS